MKRMMRNSRGLNLWIFSARLQEVNNFLPQFPGSDKCKNIPQGELKEILLYAGPHGCAKQAMMFGLDFVGDSFCAELEIFKRMEVAESIYEGDGSPSQIEHTR